MRVIVYLFVLQLLLVPVSARSQDSLVAELASRNVYLFTKSPGGYSGAGWDSLLVAAAKTNNVLIGEDHFINEIPPIVSAIAKKIHFDNFFCEVDPYTVHYLSDKIRKLSAGKLASYKRDFRDGFSFYAKEGEYELFQELVKTGVNMIGTEQVSLFSDRLLFEELAKITSVNKAKDIYIKMAAQSKQYTDSFATATDRTFYIFTDEYGDRLKELEKLSLSSREKEIITQIKLSRKIYLDQDHQLRVRLMKKQLLDNYTKLATQKNLFKYGANHMCRGESYLRIYDLGNLVHNISDSRFERSLHIMIAARSGQQGSGVPGLPADTLDPVKGDMKFLKPFFGEVTGSDYHCFDLSPLRREIEKGNLRISDKWLLRTIAGYDYLVIIPQATAAQHF